MKNRELARNAYPTKNITFLKTYCIIYFMCYYWFSSGGNGTRKSFL